MDTRQSDQALTQGLSYRAPELLLRAVQASGVTEICERARSRLWHGPWRCGLQAVLPTFDGYRPVAGHAGAGKGKNIYERLEAGDVVAASRPDIARHDLVLAAGVYVSR